MAILTDLQSELTRVLSSELLKLDVPIAKINTDSLSNHADLFILEDSKSKRSSYRNLCKNSKVIVLVGEDDSDIIKEYFDNGAYDVFVMPIRPNEILFKCQRALNQSFEDRSMFESNLELKEIGLTYKQIQIYRLLEHAGEKGVDRSEFETKLWSGENVHSKTIDVHLCNLRKRLKRRHQEIKIDKEKKWHLCSM